ncbi:MAG TPA: response regulator [Anaerolineae bacterium]|nr:response regulator [Anaerolineae bacterium]
MSGLLVVDDTALIRSTIASIVSRENLALSPIIEAKNGEEAVRMAREHQPDIVFMDIKMPGMNGLQATSVIRQEQPHSKIVMLTAYDEFSYVQEALKLGAVDYLLKPLRPQKLTEVLTHLQATIQEEQEQQQALVETQRRLDETLPLVEANLVDEIIYRQLLDLPTIEKMLQQLNKTIAMPAVMVVSIDNFNKIVKRLTQEQLQRSYESITSLVSQVIAHPADALIGQWQVGQLAVILSTAERWETVEALKALGQQLWQRVAKEIHTAVTVSFGKQYATLNAVPLSYAEARLARRHKASGDGVLHINDTGPAQPQTPSYAYPLALEKELLDNIRLKQEDMSLELVNEIVDDLLYKYKNAPEILYSYSAELLTLISRTVIDIGATATEVLDLSQRQLAVLFSSPSPAQLRAWALNSLTELMTISNMMEEKPNKDAVQLAIEYIHKHHHRPDISLNEIAKTVGLSQSHLAYLLKERLGMNYSNYLSELRLKHAKKLLRTTTLTITAIAQAVGYPNPTNFYRIFQREIGLTPKAYRQTKAG